MSAQTPQVGQPSPAETGRQGDVTLEGMVTDPSGASIVGATVVLHSLNGDREQVATTSAQGRFRFHTPAGTYTLLSSAPGFSLGSSDPLELRSGRTRTLTVRLRIDVAAERVEVGPDEVGASPGEAGNSLVLGGNEIDQLPLDPTLLNQELQAMAGGQSPEIYVNGFSGGTLPPRDNIREIRINQNPYSAMNDVNPVNGRIEILTKPGTSHLHGQFASFGSDNVLNTRDLFAPEQPPYDSYSASGNVSGPLCKHFSYFGSAQVLAFHLNAVVRAQTLGNSGLSATVLEAVGAPTTSQNHSVELDALLGKRNTFSARYNLDRSVQQNGGVGQLVLPEAGYNHTNDTGTLQLSNSAVLSQHLVMDTRVQYIRSRTHQAPNSAAPEVVVEGAFTGGGSNAGIFRDNLDRYELQNYVYAAEGKHYLSFGGRLRVARDANDSTANFNGTYTFASLADYAQALSTGGAGAGQFSLASGTPGVAVTVADLGLFVQDDWKIRSRFTLSAGLRYETQNHIGDHRDFGPRLAFSWNLGLRPGKPARFVFQGASGVFFSRLGTPQVLLATRENGVLQQNYVVTSPAFFLPGATPASLLASLGSALPSTVYTIDTRFHAPYQINSTATLTKLLGKYGTVAVSYRNVRGVRQLLTRNSNAPFEGTYNPAVPTSGVRPLGTQQEVYQYASEGVLNSNRVSCNFYLHAFGDRLFAFGYLEGRRDLSDVDGAAESPTDQYHPGQDYGRTTDDTRLYFNAGLGGEVVHNLRVFALIQARSGTPFDITLGTDANGDSFFNDRPAFATDLTRPSVVRTAYGYFDSAPLPGQPPIPVNYGTGPAFVQFNVSVTRRIPFGPRLRDADAPSGRPTSGKPVEIARKFELYLGADSQNLFNHVNLAPPVGTLNSPLFGQSVALNNTGNGSANRYVDLQAFVRF